MLFLCRSQSLPLYQRPWMHGPDPATVALHPPLAVAIAGDAGGLSRSGVAHTDKQEAGAGPQEPAGTGEVMLMRRKRGEGDSGAAADEAGKGKGQAQGSAKAAAAGTQKAGVKATGAGAKGGVAKKGAGWTPPPIQPPPSVARAQKAKAATGPAKGASEAPSAGGKKASAPAKGASAPGVGGSAPAKGANAGAAGRASVGVKKAVQPQSGTVGSVAAGGGAGATSTAAGDPGDSGDELVHKVLNTQSGMEDADETSMSGDERDGTSGAAASGGLLLGDAGGADGPPRRAALRVGPPVSDVTSPPRKRKWSNSLADEDGDDDLGPPLELDRRGAGRGRSLLLSGYRWGVRLDARHDCWGCGCVSGLVGL